LISLRRYGIEIRRIEVSFKRLNKAFIAVSLCFVMAFATPVSILAEEPEIEDSRPVDSGVSEEASSPEGSAPGESAPEGSAPGESAPEGSAPEGSPPEEGASGESVPGENEPSEKSPYGDDAPSDDDPLQEDGTQPDIVFGTAAAAAAPVQKASADVAAQPAGSDQGSSSDRTDIVINKKSSTYGTDSVTTDGLTIYVKGLTDENREELFSKLAKRVPSDLEENNSRWYGNEYIIDAEKFADPNYDDNLCWAACASNMLWISGYAQKAVNPYTTREFANVDEVFDYFKKTFTDKGGSIEEGIKYFLSGTYGSVGIDGVAQIKDNGIKTGGLLPETRYTLNSVWQEADNDILSALHDLADVSATVYIAFIDTETGELIPGQHGLSVMGLVVNEKATGFTDRYKGIILNDSNDSAPWNSLAYGPSGLGDEERAKRAAEAENSIAIFPLAREMVGGIEYWTLVDFPYFEHSITIIFAVYTLSDLQSDVSAEEKKEILQDNSDDNDRSGNETPDIIPPDQENDIDYDVLKAAMILNNLLVYSPQASKYNRAEDAGYTLYVRRSATMMGNVYVDGARVPGNGIGYRIVMLPNGMFKLIFSREYMQSLSKGKHTVKLEFGNEGDIETTIEVYSDK
jgi:hypothetical protein